MNDFVDVKLFFNFRSPYCYIASKYLADILDNYRVNLVWRPLGGWNGRSEPERAKVKLPIARQDVARITRKMGIPMQVPPKTTDPTIAGAGSVLAEQKGLLRAYILEVIHWEWGLGQDIGDRQVLLRVGEKVGLDQDELSAAIESEENLKKLEANWAEASTLGVFGVPSFVVGEEIFWGADRIDYLVDYLKELNLAT